MTPSSKHLKGRAVSTLEPAAALSCEAEGSPVQRGEGRR